MLALSPLYEPPWAESQGQDMNERLVNPISTAELERRWTATRQEMKARDLDAIVLQSNNDWLGGYVKWFTDHAAVNGYPKSVIFHANDFMTLVDMGPRGARRVLGGNDEVFRGVGEILSTPMFTSVNYTDDYQGEIVGAELKKRAYKKIGIVGGGALPHTFMSQLEQDLAGRTELIDVTDAVDRLKAIKSAEEISWIRKVAAMQDEIFSRVLGKIYPGMRDTEVTALAQYEGRLLGSEQGLFLASSAPLGQRAGFLDRYQQGRTIQAGDHFTLLIENNGPACFYAEIARTIVLGKASQQLQDGFAAMKAAQDYTLSLIKPGASCRGIAAAHDEYMKKNGFPPELRLYCHGQGYDLVERPLVRWDETMTLEEGMNLAVHPGADSEQMFAVICDNYIVEKNGPSACLHKTEKKIFEI